MELNQKKSQINNILPSNFGLTESQIEFIESKYQLSLPELYRTFLEKIGQLSSQFFFDFKTPIYSYLCEKTEIFLSSFHLNFPDHPIPQNLFVFGEESDIGPYFYFFCKNNPDPPVYLGENNIHSKFIAHRISSFLLAQLFHTETIKFLNKLELRHFNFPTQSNHNFQNDPVFITSFIPPEIPIKFDFLTFYERNISRKRIIGCYLLNELYDILFNQLSQFSCDISLKNSNSNESQFFDELKQKNSHKQVLKHIYHPDFGGIYKKYDKTVSIVLVDISFIPSSIRYLEFCKLFVINNGFNEKISKLVINEDIQYLKNLELVIITKCDVESLPEEIGLIPNLKYLRIIDNPKLKKLPDSICNLQHLEELRLENNHLEELPQNIGKLKNLKSLIVFHNFLTELPDTLGELTELEELSLWQNKVEKLPNTIGNLEKLYWLNATSNNLKTIPESIGYLKNLGHLLLTDNFLESVPQSLEHLQKIEKMDLGMNNLRDIPAGLKNRPEVITAGNLF